MKVSNIQNTNFKGALNNKLVLGALEKISDHSATFTALSAVGASMLLRPLAISLTPNVKKENKEHSIANSISSGAIKLLTTCALSIPIEGAIKNIEKNSDKFLNSKAKEFLEDKNSFNFASQILKLSSNIVSAIPKSVLTITLIPLIMDKIIKPKKEEADKTVSQPTFKGKLQDNFTKLVSNYFNNEKIQNFAAKNQNNSVNIARNMAIATDLLLTGSFALSTKKSKKIDSKRKNNLIYNNLISTGLSVLGGLGLDKLVQKQGKGIIEKFIEANKNDPKLTKYLQGINVLRPTVVFALIYYGVLPIVSNYFAQRISDKKGE